MFLAVGVVLGIYLQPSPSNQVLYVRERDGRGEEYDIRKEDPISLETKTSPALRFFKYGRSYVFSIRRKFQRPKKIARFFCKEGTAYTWTLTGHHKKKKIDLKFPTLEKAVLFSWGKHFYNTVPERQKEKLRSKKVKVAVDLEAGLTPESPEGEKGFTPITESTVKKKANEDMAGLIAAGVKNVVKKSAIEVLPWIGCGVAIGIILVAVGLLDVGGSAEFIAVARNGLMA